MPVTTVVAGALLVVIVNGRVRDKRQKIGKDVGREVCQMELPFEAIACISL